MADVKTLPIIFSAPMVCPLLDGRKTQTRRIIEPPKWSTGVIDMELGDDGVYAIAKETGCLALVKPKYAVGDRLWVKEGWAAGVSTGNSWHADSGPGSPSPKMQRRYRADGEGGFCGKWRSPRFMPRWASRITLEVTEVRVERLNEISESDAEAEGLTRVSKDGKIYKWGIPDRDGLPGSDDLGWHWQDWERDPRAAYARLWNSLHGSGAWEANPWVAAISFKRVVTANG